MDIKASSTNKEAASEGSSPFAGTIADPLCNLHLKETSDFVKAFPLSSSTVSRRRSMEAPPTPGKPAFSFSAGNLSRKSIPSKWDDAEKWLISGSCHGSPAHVNKPKISRPLGVHQKGDAFAQKQKARGFQDSDAAVVLQDKFTDNVEPACPNFRYTAPNFAAIEEVAQPQHRHIGTETTPMGSVATSRCHTPVKCSSPARHNTPADSSGPLAASMTATLDVSDLKDRHFAKLQLSAQYDPVASSWSSREVDEAEVSKSLRHYDTGGAMKSIAETRASLWEDEERAKICIRYQREEAKIQAWVNLQSAKSEAQARKLEVKIQMMRSNLEEKLMRRMAIVQRRAQESRAAAQLQHSQQILRASEQAQKMKTHQTFPVSCGCFPSNKYLL